MSSKYRGAFLNILTCFSKERKFSTVSISRTCDTGHMEKEPSLRISKQSFEADSSLLEYRSKKCPHRNSKNHLTVPEKHRTALLIVDDSKKNKICVNDVSFVKISPEGKLDDALEMDGCAGTEQNNRDELRMNSYYNSNNEEPINERNLIVTMTRDNYKNYVDELNNHYPKESDRRNHNVSDETVV